MSDTEKDPVVIDEVVTLDPEESEAKFARAEFATVVFHNIAETYPEDAHIECSYTVTADLIPSTRDYVALYKVGWMSPRDYIYYEWAPIPKDYKQGTDADASVMFPAHKLPKDDGEFYQFCYVSSSNQIKGASTPFQFRKPGADDFIEVEDEETNMLVIRSKTVYLEENLQKAESQKQRLLEMQEALQKERDSVIAKYQEVKSRLVAVETDNAKLKGQLSSSETIIQQQKQEARDLITVRDELQAKIDKLKKERETLNQSIDTLTSDLEAANEKIKTLKEELTAAKADLRKSQSEKDELAGKNAMLEEEAELYKKQVESSTKNMDHYTKQSESVQIKLAQQESLIEHLRYNVDLLTTELEDNRQNLDQQTAINMQDKDLVQDLEERLRNAEDKLSAAEQSKEILQKEINSFEITQHEMSRTIEKSKTECEGLKQKVCRLEEDFTQKTQIQALEMEQTLGDLQASVQQKETLQKENSDLRHQLERSVEGQGSRSVLQLTLEQIKERLERREKRCKALEKMMNGRDQDFKEREREMRREIEDLKEKIYMCGEEYKRLYIENSKMKKRINKAEGKKKSRGENKERSDTEGPLETKLEAEVPLTNSEVLLSREIEEHLELFQKDHEKKLIKTENYRMKLREEREKNEHVKKTYEEIIQEKDAEIARLKKRIRDEPNEWDLRLRALEKCVTEKELIIENLNKKLLETSQGKTNEMTMSPTRSAPVQQEPKWNYPYHNGTYNCPNPPVYPYPTAYPYPGPVQYPYPVVSSIAPVQTQPQPLVYPYPAQVPPVPPRNKAPARDQDKQDQQGGVMDKADADCEPLEAPLQPLPAPLEPQRLPSAKLAAVRAASGHDDANGMVDGFENTELDGIVEQLKVSLPHEQKPAVYPLVDFIVTENDRFYDAEGSSMKICGECNKTFPPDVDEETFVEHQMSHIGTLCPVCKMMKPDNMSDEDFARHVNKHYDEEDCVY